MIVNMLKLRMYFKVFFIVYRKEVFWKEIYLIYVKNNIVKFLGKRIRLEEKIFS